MQGSKKKGLEVTPYCFVLLAQITGREQPLCNYAMPPCKWSSQNLGNPEGQRRRGTEMRIRTSCAPKKTGPTLHMGPDPHPSAE
ncbi:unnamed protein product [Caretta caretta]